MAEISAAVALATAVAKFSKFLHGRANILLNVEDDIEWLMGELNWMQSFLKDAENKRDTNHVIQQWVDDVRDLADDCVDAIDTFLVELREPEAMSSCISYLKNLHSTSKLSRQIKLSRQLKKLQRKANNISIRRNRYHLKPDAHSTDGNLMDLRRTTPYAQDEHMVGQDETINLLTAELINGKSGHFIISIFGMGGLGKTTLARKLYVKLRQQYFKSYAWIWNPQVSDARAIILQLIKSMTNPSKEDLEGLDSMDSMELYLHKFLSGCRFLLVIDDLWEWEAWESLKRAIPDDNVNGSKVIITTRNMKVAAMNKAAYVHELRYLNEDESWRLFCKKALLDDNDMMTSSPIAHVGREMVEKCLGLPLAIVTLGGLLSTKSNTREWIEVRHNLWKQLEEESTHINALLLLSFRDLPYYLQRCFLYIGMFPEHFEIPVSKLILLWVAEGFIESEKGSSPESVAKSCFDELVGRSLFQKKGEDWIDNTFRVHDLLRDLAIKKAKEMHFSVYYDEELMFNLTRAASHKRLASFHPSFGSLHKRYTNPSLRTLFIGSTGVKTGNLHMNDQQLRIRSSYKVLRSVHKRFGLLRVLDIQVHYGDDFKPQELPSEIGSMIHLRYLGLHLLKSAIRELPVPDTIGNLKALQTLSVTSNLILSYCTLPSTTEKLKTLRHLIGNFRMGDWIGKLIALETLQGITYEQWCGIDTKNLFNLRHLSLTNVPQLEASPARFYDKFQTTKKLQTLSLENSELASISVREIFICCPLITHFKTSGINFITSTSTNLHMVAINLEVLDLVYYKNPVDDPIPLIERLPALRALRMEYYSEYDQRIVCSEEGFPQLRTLVLEIYHNVTFSVAEGCMPLLTSLRTKTYHNLEAPKRLMDLIVMF